MCTIVQMFCSAALAVWPTPRSSSTRESAEGISVAYVMRTLVIQIVRLSQLCLVHWQTEKYHSG